MPIEEKTKRNKKLILLWKKGLTYRQLGKIFRIDFKTAYDIIHRDKKRKKRRGDK